ncbi:MAG: hypothetical protein J3K34DRAFT_516920 [Monoraphidium minutum]|nr:MAG: hypothetical protein J3K34DRAFT_516920 [Monoraphidium minutum]
MYAPSYSSSEAPTWREKAALALRIVQAAFGVMLLGSAAHLARTYGGWGTAGLGVFAGLAGVAAAALYLAAPRSSNVALQRVLPGLIDIITSSLLAIFSLAAGAGAAAANVCGFGDDSGDAGDIDSFFYWYSAAAPSGACAAAGAASAAGVLLFLASSASAVLAGLDLRDGAGLCAPHSSMGRRGRAPDPWGGIMTAPPAAKRGPTGFGVDGGDNPWASPAVVAPSAARFSSSGVV